VFVFVFNEENKSARKFKLRSALPHGSWIFIYL